MKSGWPAGSRRYIRENREHSALAGIVQDTSFEDLAEPFVAQGQFFGMQGKPLGSQGKPFEPQGRPFGSQGKQE